jgi:hypothetical protein
MNNIRDFEGQYRIPLTPASNDLMHLSYTIEVTPLTLS